MCSDPETAWYPQRSVCWSEATTKNIARRWFGRYDKSQPDAHGFKPTDGVTLWVSTEDLTPDDGFLDGV